MLGEKIWQEEKGIVSLFAVIIIAVFTFFSTAVYFFSRNEQLTINHFLLGSEVKNRAQDGIQLASKVLNNDTAKVNEIHAAAGNVVQIVSQPEINNRASCKVYAKDKADNVVVLSVAKKQGVSRRAVAYFKKLANGRYLLEHAEN